MTRDNIYADVPPMFQQQFLAHSLGGYQGFRYLNCEEGLLNALLHGYRYFEVDLLLTDDGELVCSHGWDEENCAKTGMTYAPEFEHMTRECFLGQKVHGYTTMDAARLYQYMVMFPNTYWELDLHTLPKPTAARTAKKILEVFEHNEHVLDRCLVQVNSKKMYFAIDAVYHFKYYQYNIRESMEELDDYIAFSVRHGICAMGMKRMFATEENIKKVRSAGLALLVFTVDKWAAAARMLEWGANTICTNFIGLTEAESTVRATVFYNSTPHAWERISKLTGRNVLRGSLHRAANGSYEYEEEAVFSNEGTYRLTGNLFRKGWYRFKGWNVRRRNAAGEWEWHCADGQWRTEGERAQSGEKLSLLKDCAVINSEFVGIERRIFFIAKWK